MQAPQDYRDDKESRSRLHVRGVRGFFRIGMVERNEHNAIIQHGTMCLIRREAMERIGGWAKWCITEDTEFGLRCSRRAIPRLHAGQHGRGLMPDTLPPTRASAIAGSTAPCRS